MPQLIFSTLNFKTIIMKNCITYITAFLIKFDAPYDMLCLPHNAILFSVLDQSLRLSVLEIILDYTVVFHKKLLRDTFLICVSC